MLIATFITGCAKSSQPEISIETTLANFSDAFRSGDYDTVEAHIADEYLHVNSGAAPYDRAQWLGWYETYAQEIVDGEHVFANYSVEALKIARYNDAAFVTGIVRANGVRHGETFNQDIRFTNLWIIEDGQWKRAGFHDTGNTEQED